MRLSTENVFNVAVMQDFISRKHYLLPGYGISFEYRGADTLVVGTG